MALQKLENQNTYCDVAVTETLLFELVCFDWWTDYSSENDRNTDRLWDAINPGHGIDGKYAKD